MSKKLKEMGKRGITISVASSDGKGGLVLRIPAGTLYLLAALPVGFLAVLLLAYLFFPIPAGYKVTGAESSAVVERLSFIEKELAVSHEMASRMARLVGIELEQDAGKKDSAHKEKSGFTVLAGDENGARIFPLDGVVELKSGQMVIHFVGKDSVRASGSGVVFEVIRNGLANWKISVQHKNGYVTSYVGNLSPFVRKGDPVNLGDVIALATPPRFGSGKLEFGIFKGGQSMNPFAAFLDKSTDVAPAQSRKPAGNTGAKYRGVRNS